MTTKSLEQQITNLQEVARRPRITTKEIESYWTNSTILVAKAREDGAVHVAQESLDIITKLQAELAEVKAEKKIWQEMVVSTNQTHQAMSKMLDEFENKTRESLKELRKAADKAQGFNEISNPIFHARLLLKDPELFEKLN